MTRERDAIGAVERVLIDRDRADVWVRIEDYDLIPDGTLRVDGELAVDPDDWERLYRANVAMAGLVDDGA